MYVSCSDTAVSTVLLSEAEGTQRPVYYHSRSLQGAEIRYPYIKKLALVVVSVARRLNLHFHAHTNHPDGLPPTPILANVGHFRPSHKIGHGTQRYLSRQGDKGASGGRFHGRIDAVGSRTKGGGMVVNTRRRISQQDRLRRGNSNQDSHWREGEVLGALQFLSDQQHVQIRGPPVGSQVSESARGVKGTFSHRLPTASGSARSLARETREPPSQSS